MEFYTPSASAVCVCERAAAFEFYLAQLPYAL